MDIKLILLDLDGTLLTSEKTLSRENRAALEKAAGRGIEIVPATGRFYRAIPEEVRSLDFVRYAVTVNGGQIYDALEDKVLHRAEIPIGLAERVFDRAETLPVLYDCFLDDHAYMTRRQYEMADDFVPDSFVRHAIKTLREPVDDLRDFVRRQGRPLQKTQMFFRDMDLRAKMLPILTREFPELAVTTSLPVNIELNIAAATKGNALDFLCRHLGLDASQTMAFGDGSNDLSMLQVAGIGVAMGNAAPGLLAAADYVTRSNDDHGVAHAIEKFCF